MIKKPLSQYERNQITQKFVQLYSKVKENAPLAMQENGASKMNLKQRSNMQNLRKNQEMVELLKERISEIVKNRQDKEDERQAQVRLSKVVQDKLASKSKRAWDGQSTTYDKSMMNLSGLNQSLMSSFDDITES